MLNNKIIRIGFLPLCMAEFDAVLDVPDVRNEQIPDINEPEYLKDMIDYLGYYGFVFSSGVVGDEKSAEKANKFFKSKIVDVIIVHEFAFTLAKTFIKSIEDLDVPIIFWNTQEKHIISKYTDFGQVMSNNSISSIPHSTNTLYRSGKKFHVITGHKGMKKVQNRFDMIFKVLIVKKLLKSCRIGAVGYAYPGMLTLAADEVTLRTKIGPVLEHINISEISNAIKRVPQGDISDEVICIRSSYITEELTNEEVVQSAKIYLGLKDLLKKKKINVLTTLCGLMVLDDELGLAPCYAMSKLIEDGIQSACECDILTAVTLYIVELLAGNAWFTEFYMMDMEEELIMMSHCGYGNYSLANSKYPIKAVRQCCFPGAKGRGLAFEFTAKEGEITIVSLTDGPEGYKIISAEAFAVDVPPFPTGCPQIIVKFKNKEMGIALEEYCKAGGAHHMVVAYGNIIEELALLAKYLGIGFESI